MEKFNIEDTYAFGETKRPMTMQDFELFQINPSLEMHILRHFAYASDEYKKSLIGKEYYYFDYQNEKFKKAQIDDEKIEIALETKGTKFYKNIVGLENPRKLLQKAKSVLRSRIVSKDISVIKSNDKSKIMFSFTHDQNVGEIDYLAIDEIPTEKRELIEKQPRSSSGEESSVLINVIKGIPKMKTNRICFILNTAPELPFYFATAFPGHLDPDFGDNKELADKYWASMVFVI